MKMVVLGISVAMLALSIGWTAARAEDAPKGTPAVAAVADKMGPLGDLSAFKKIAEDTLVLVQTNDLVAAKARIKDLETAWDKAEEQLRKMNQGSWTSVDKSIDRALAQLRSGKPDAAACTTALKTLIAKFDTIGKAPAK